VTAVLLLYCALVLALCAWVMWTGRDAWPFSSYPMFAEYRARPVLEFHRLRFVGDETEDLTASDSGLADEFDLRFARVWRSTQPELRGSACAGLVRRYWRAASTLRPALEETRRLEVVVRAAFLDSKKPIVVVERLVYQVDAADFTEAS